MKREAGIGDMVFKIFPEMTREAATDCLSFTWTQTHFAGEPTAESHVVALGARHQGWKPHQRG